MVKCISATKCILHPRAHVEKKLINDWLEEVTTEAPSPVFCRFWSSYVSKRGIFLGDFLMYNQKRNVLLTHYIHCISWGSATQFGPNLAFEKRLKARYVGGSFSQGQAFCSQYEVEVFFSVLHQIKTKNMLKLSPSFFFHLVAAKPKAGCISNQSLTMHGSRSGASSAVEFISTRNQGQHLGELSASPDSWPCLPLLLACMWTCSRTRKHAERHVARLFWSHIWCKDGV